MHMLVMESLRIEKWQMSSLDLSIASCVLARALAELRLA